MVAAAHKRPPETNNDNTLLSVAVSYTHLDVYKRQVGFLWLHHALVLIYGSLTTLQARR